MLEYDKIKSYLIKNIGEKRFLHSVRVMNTAENLASIYGCDIEKASVAGLLHDCGKLIDKSLFIKLCEDYNITNVDIEIENNISILHGAIGAEIAYKVFDINDKDILDSIKYHTTGKPNMSILEKIIYIADYIEPERKFDGVEYIRELVLNDIDRALLYAMDNTIKYVIDNGYILHCDTILARNYLISHKN